MKNKMNFLFKQPRLLVSAAILIAGVFATAQTVSDARFRKKSYKVSPETTLEIENKYGTILIVPWNKDSVQITADIFLEAKSASKLRKLQNDIDVSFAGTSNYIIARTIIGDGGSKVASELRALSNTLVSSSTVEINYTIYLPVYVNLVLTNKFGDIYIDDLSGDVDISLSNGVLKANSFSGNSRVELIFAKGTIRELATSSLNLSYAEFTLGNAEQLDIVSKSSGIEIDTAGVIKLESRRDKIEVNKVEYLYGNSSFTDVLISEFIREVDCNMNYGKMVIENVLPEFSRIKINSDYTDITLFTSALSTYNIDILHNEKAIVHLPLKNADLKTIKTGEEFLTTDGTVGTGKSQKSISIKAEHKCYINITSR